MSALTRSAAVRHSGAGRMTRPLMTIVMLLVAAPLFAYSAPSVWPYGDVYTIIANAYGGSLPAIHGGSFHRFEIQRDEDPAPFKRDSATGGGTQDWVVVPVTRPEKLHVRVRAQRCWYIPVFDIEDGCGDWSPWVDVWANERPGAPGELRGNYGARSACADVIGLNAANNAPIGTWTCWGGDNQKWIYTAAHTLRGFASKCASTWHFWQGELVSTYSCGNYVEQQWSFTNATLQGLAGKCATAPGGNTSNGTQAVVQDCVVGSVAQMFHVLTTGEIRGPGNTCLDVFSFGTNNGTPVVFWSCNGFANQQWTIGQNGEIRGYGNKCLEVAGFDVNNGAKLQMWDCHGGTNQKFWITGEVRNYADMCLDMPMYTPMGTQLQVWQCWGGTNQKWQFTP